MAATVAPGMAAGAPGGAGPRAATAPTELQRDVDAVRATGVSGVVAEAVTPSGTTRARAGTADLRTGRPVPYGAHFQGGSNTKTYVATVVLQLVGEGRLSLADTVDEWLPGVVRGNGNDGRKITVRNLLQHTSGLRDYADDLPLHSRREFEEHRADRFTPRELVAMAVRHRPVFRPGETGPGGTPRWAYSNTGYILAGMIIERVTGHAWQDEVGRRVLTPLHLTGTSFPRTRHLPPRPFLRGYRQFEPGGPLVDTTLIEPSWGGSAGTLVTTAADHDRFFRALIGGRLLRPAQLAQMRTTVPVPPDGPAPPGARYGLGLAWYPLPCSKAGYWGHGGDTLGFMTREGVTPDTRRAVTVEAATELTGAAGDEAERRVAATIRHVLCGG